MLDNNQIQNTMIKNLCYVAMIALFFSCKKETIYPTTLVGKWMEHHYSIGTDTFSSDHKIRCSNLNYGFPIINFTEDGNIIDQASCEKGITYNNHLWYIWNDDSTGIKVFHDNDSVYSYTYSQSNWYSIQLKRDSVTYYYTKLLN